MDPCLKVTAHRPNEENICTNIWTGLVSFIIQILSNTIQIDNFENVLK